MSVIILFLEIKINESQVRIGNVSILRKTLLIMQLFSN